MASAKRIAPIVEISSQPLLMTAHTQETHQQTNLTEMVSTRNRCRVMRIIAIGADSSTGTQGSEQISL